MYRKKPHKHSRSTRSTFILIAGPIFLFSLIGGHLVPIAVMVIVVTLIIQSNRKKFRLEIKNHIQSLEPRGHNLGRASHTFIPASLMAKIMIYPTAERIYLFISDDKIEVSGKSFTPHDYAFEDIVQVEYLINDKSMTKITRHTKQLDEYVLKEELSNRVKRYGVIRSLGLRIQCKEETFEIPFYQEAKGNDNIPISMKGSTTELTDYLTEITECFLVLEEIVHGIYMEKHSLIPLQTEKDIRPELEKVVVPPVSTDSIYIEESVSPSQLADHQDVIAKFKQKQMVDGIARELALDKERKQNPDNYRTEDLESTHVFSEFITLSDNTEATIQEVEEKLTEAKEFADTATPVTEASSPSESAFSNFEKFLEENRQKQFRSRLKE
ncbi:hypothetical protein ACFFIS_15460 [Virgibacillus soli]|uniref:Uncharacterized protein n=1 Tax=Paracerasibacillus soli TaxID=480284 RepID=A0ABU5CUX0_9BACI|nr:hypothetical protein [Virgibacillus soli]MDY0410173.1 hypothetical protein [Virgibacillus soli]